MFLRSVGPRARTAVRCSSTTLHISVPSLRASISTNFVFTPRKEGEPDEENRTEKRGREKSRSSPFVPRKEGRPTEVDNGKEGPTRFYSEKEQVYFRRRGRERAKLRQIESTAWGIAEDEWDKLPRSEWLKKRKEAKEQQRAEHEEALRIAKDLRKQIDEAKKMQETEIIKELPGDAKEDVLFDTLFGVRTIELHRPEKLHSLNGSMIRKIVPRLQEWQKSDMANVIIIKGSGPKAFCAGGDVAALALDNEKGPEGQQRSADYFALEYKLDHLIATFPKPYIAYMDGITMGGGVGLSIHAPFRIATERTVFAMPETTIGFFPDVGASFFLPRMNGAIGTYLALTSQRLKGVNTYYAGIATHYIHSTSLYSLERRLAELRFKDYTPLNQRLDIINSTIEEFVTGLPHDEPIVLGGEVRKAIDRCFGRTNIPDILAALRAEIRSDKEETKLWAEQTLASLNKRSPTSVYVTLRQMQLGRNWSISETFQREHQLAAKFMAHQDFTEGVKALLIEKHGNPRWEHGSLEEVTKNSTQISVDQFFVVDPTKQLRFLGAEQDWKEYPYKYGLPTENQIREHVVSTGQSKQAVVQYFVKKTHGKQGVKEVVQEILERKTTTQDSGSAVWVDEAEGHSSILLRDGQSSSSIIAKRIKL